MSILSSKQKKVLEIINRFGVISSTQLILILKGEVSHVTIYKSREKFIELGFIGEEKIGYNLILFIKPTGVKYLNSELTSFTKINYAMLNHQLIMNDCIIALKQLLNKDGENMEFITERELRSEYLSNNFSREDRRNTTLLKKVPDMIPDFVVFENGKKIACEVELTQKSRKRYMNKFNRYKDEILNNDYDKIRYLCDNKQIMKTVDKYASSVGFSQSMFQRDLIERLVNIEGI